MRSDTRSSGPASAWQLDPERYEQARADALHIWRAETLEHRSAQHRLFAIEIVRGMGADAAVAEEIGTAAEQEWGDPRNFELFPDVVPLLEVLQASPCTVGLVSNTDRELEAFAAQLGIGVDFALASRAHGRRKPCETIFAAALALGGASATRRSWWATAWTTTSRAPPAAVFAPCSSIAMRRYPDHPGERISGLAELPPLLGLGAEAAATPPASA